MYKRQAEILTASWRRAYRGRIATVRAGNVIGGGDYGEDRIVPDCIRALLAGTSIAVRNPAATRPWQHVLDCLSGYLWLGTRLAEEETLAAAFNFGPRSEAQRSVQELVETTLSLSLNKAEILMTTFMLIEHKSHLLVNTNLNKVI